MEEQEASPAARKRRILLVEDDPGIEEIMSDMIRSIVPNCEIHWVRSCEEALLRVQIRPIMPRSSSGLSDSNYDLIIADVFLDGRLTGIDFWQECQALCPKTPMLIVSSMSINSFLQTVGPNNAAPPFLAKPFRIGECRQMVEGLLEYGTSI